MKLEIIHLSDFHITKDFNSVDFVEKIYESLIIERDGMSDTVVLCITGDLTKYSDKIQFDVFGNMLTMLEKKFKEKSKELIIYFVPGNHDISLKVDEEQDRIQKINKSCESNDFNELTEEYLNNMNNFFEFAKKYNLFLNNKFIDLKTITISGKKIQFNLLNTVLFSLLTKNDKEKHYIPLEYLNYSLKDVDYNITLMHHSNEWFLENCEYKMDYILERSSFYLFGHQHKSQNITKDNSRGFLATEVNFYKLEESPFRIYILDLEDQIVKQILVYYDKQYDKYLRDEFNNFNILRIEKFGQYKKEKSLFYKKNSQIDFDNRMINIDNIFVMPVLSIENDINSITSFGELIDYINANRIINILGYSKGGKTILLKKLFIEYIKQNKYVLYIDDLTKITNNFSNSIKHIFIDNYGDADINEFYQEEKRNRILIVDDNLNTLEKKHFNFLEESIDLFNIVVYSTDIIYENRKEMMYDNLSKQANKIKIEPFTLKQRHSLVENISSIYDQSNNVNEIIKCLNSIISNDMFIDLTNPNNLTLLLINLIKDRMYIERDTKDAFSIMFEYNIVSKVKNNIEEKYVSDSYLILEEIAYYMFNTSENCYMISAIEIIEIIKKNKETWGYKVPYNTFLNMIKKSRLMKEENDNYQFVNNSYYSFFVGKYISKKISRNENVNDDIEKLMKKITYGNYGDILLFVAYFINNDNFFENIMDYINDLTKEWKKLSYDLKNHYILEKKIKDDSIFNEKFETKEHLSSRIDKKERKIVEYKKNETNEEKYKTYEESELNDVKKTLKLIEILSKGINGYSGIITVAKRKNMITTVKDSIYRLIYKAFDFSNEEYDDYLEWIEKSIKEKIKDINIDLKKEFTNFLFQQLSTFTLNVITCVANLMISNLSIDIIDEIEDKNSEGNIIFDNILFKTICYERYGKEEKIVKYIENIYNDIKNDDQKYMIRKIFAMFVITSSISDSNIEKICNITKLDKSKIMMLNPGKKEKLIKLASKINK